MRRGGGCVREPAPTPSGLAGHDDRPPLRLGFPVKAMGKLGLKGRQPDPSALRPGPLPPDGAERFGAHAADAVDEPERMADARAAALEHLPHPIATPHVQYSTRAPGSSRVTRSSRNALSSAIVAVS